MPKLLAWQRFGRYKDADERANGFNDAGRRRWRLGTSRLASWSGRAPAPHGDQRRGTSGSVGRHGASVPVRPVIGARKIERAFAQIASQEPEIRAWVEVDYSGLRLAPAAGPLTGWTIGVKDVIDVSGLPTRAGSATRSGVAPAAVDAPAVALLRAAGAIVIGKTTTTEFATMDPAPTANPAARGHTPGGSSSGSAAAVAAGMADLSLGTQTAGSLCRPAAYCGIAAFKPTYRRVPTGGIVPLAPSFDTVGLMARDVERLAVALPCWGISAEALPEAPVVGIASQASHPDLEAPLAAALERAAACLRLRRARTVAVRLPFNSAEVIAFHRRIMAAEAFAEHGGLLNDGRVGPRFRELLAEGAAVSAADAAEARERLVQLGEASWRGFGGFDALLLPPAPGPAPAGRGTTGPAHYQIPWSAFGGPLVVVPSGTTPEGLPLGVMLAARPGDDGMLLSLALALEGALREDAR